MDATVKSDDCCSLGGARGGRSGLAKDGKISFWKVEAFLLSTHFLYHRTHIID